MDAPDDEAASATAAAAAACGKPNKKSGGAAAPGSSGGASAAQEAARHAACKPGDELARADELIAEIARDDGKEPGSAVSGARSASAARSFLCVFVFFCRCNGEC